MCFGSRPKEKCIISKQLEQRCTKMCMDIYTKQIGNCLDSLVLAKQVPQFMKTLSKEIVKRVTVLTKSETSQISQTRQRMPYQILQSHISKTHNVNETLPIESYHWYLLRENHLRRVFP